MEKEVKVDVTINVEAVRSAGSSADSLENVKIDIPVVDARSLRLNDQVFGFKVVPIDDQDKTVDDETAVCIAVEPIQVDSLAQPRSGFVTVNGTIDIPVSGSTTKDLEEVFLTNEADAMTVAEILTEIELERVMTKIKKIEKIKKFLTSQLDERRF